MTWYSCDPEQGITLHSSEADAMAQSEADMEHYTDRAEADGEWHPDIAQLEWGIMVPAGRAQATESVGKSEEFPDGWELWELVPVSEETE